MEVPEVSKNEKETNEIKVDLKEKPEEKKEKKDPDIAKMELDKVLKIN